MGDSLRASRSTCLQSGSPPDFPALGGARAEGAGIPRGEGPPTQAHEALGDFVSFLISIFFFFFFVGYGANITFPPGVTEQ